MTNRSCRVRPHPSSRRARAIIRGVSTCLAIMAMLPTATTAQTVVKLATLVPDGSVWHRILQDQATAIKRASAGALELRIYPGGVAGDDPDMVRKMRIGQFQAAALTVQGLVEIDEAFRVFNVPLFFASPEEAFFVLDGLEPVLRQRLEARGFILLNWGYAGWAHLYSRRPVRTVNDLRGQKIFLWGGEERAMRIWREHGLQPVGLAATDIMMALQTGMADALVTTPLAVLSLQWFRLTGYQLDPGLAPLIGATVMPRRAWERLTEHERAVLSASAKAAGSRFRSDVTPHETRAIAEMEERGLRRTSMATTGADEWQALLKSLAEANRGQLVPADIFDLAVRIRAEFRSRGPVATAR